MNYLTKTFRFLLWSCFAGFCALALIFSSMYLYLSPALPDVQTLRDFRLQTPMRVMSSDGQLIAEYGEQRRSPLRYEQIPALFVSALVAIEDKRFEAHSGVDPIRFTRVVLDLLQSGNKEGAGGSTLTQQVARNYFLTQQKTFTRKFTEILLALRMEGELSKKEIFELYANKHFLGYRSYGIQAAATVYYGRDINDLTLPELAMIAGLHQAPSAANPIANEERATRRRNAVLNAMLDNQFITQAEFIEASSSPLTAKFHGNNPDFEAYYVAEMVRSEMIDRFGERAYIDGYTVYTTVNSTLQQAADSGIRRALIDYSKRHGYLGAEGSIFETPDDVTKLPASTPLTDEDIEIGVSKLNEFANFGGLVPAIVIDVKDESFVALPKNYQDPISISLESVSWARTRINVDELGPNLESMLDVVRPGDIIRLELDGNGEWALAQVPQAQGALIALSPEDGSIQAMVGGFDYVLNKFNRAVQSKRQPGSNFKPFVYAAALDKGYTPATIINDAPLVRSDSALEDVWRPKNSGDRYLGPIPMRQALYQSRNLSSIRILDDIGVRYSRNYLSRFGFDPATLNNDMTLVLGSTAVSPLSIAKGYAVFANGGYAVEPYLIAQIEDTNGNIVYTAEPQTVCRGCPETAIESPDQPFTQGVNIEPLLLEVEGENNTGNQSPKPQHAPQVLSPQTAFLLSSMLKDVFVRGTARSARSELPRSDIAGKTGTTNDAVDAWFTGYNADFVAATWIGFDNNTSLGRNEFGGKAALPAWLSFMKAALANKPLNSQPQPVGIVQARIDNETGLLARPNTPNSRFEFFKEGSAPTEFGTPIANTPISNSNDPESPQPTTDTVESLF